MQAAGDRLSALDAAFLYLERPGQLLHVGGIYTSGPWGTPTQTSWFWKSDDNGINWHTIGIVPQKSNGHARNRHNCGHE